MTQEEMKMMADKCHEEYIDGYKSGYEIGLSDAWECAKKIILSPSDGGLTFHEINSIFGEEFSTHEVLRTFTPQYAMRQIKRHELINIGDEVTRIGEIGVVLVKDNNRHQVYVLTYNGIHVWHIDDIEKTGRHFDQVQDLIQQMRMATV